MASQVDVVGEIRSDSTSVLASYATSLEVAKLPEATLSHARFVLGDTIGVLLSASRRHAVHTAITALRPAEGEFSMVGHGTANAETAAFVNGIGGHDIELDDSHSPSRTHPAAVIIPAALAGAEHRHDSTLGELVAAIVAAYDVQSRVSKAIGPTAQYDRGFHPSSVCGAIGSATAAGAAMRLSVEEMRYAIGLAASQSSGLLTYADDPFHMAKSFQTGIAARNGVTAARFASAGYRAAPNVLTGRNNVMQPFGGEEADVSQFETELGSRFDIHETSLKRHACCGLTHSAVDALLQLLAEDDLRPESIRSIDVEVPHKAVPRIDGNTLWSHNIQYVLALAAHERHIDLDHFTPAWTENRAIQELASKVTLRGSDELQARFPARKGAVVTVRRIEGAASSLRVDAPRGSPYEPLTADELHEKFSRLAAAVLDASAAEHLWSTLVTANLDTPVRDVSTQLSRRRR